LNRVTVGKPAARRKRRGRPNPVQLALFKPRGGKRRGAGRKPKGRRAGSPHKTRPMLAARYPVHVVLRVTGAVGNLRRRFTYRAIREATLTTARRENFRIIHVSIQRTHVHLLVEADHKDALAAGMQGFQISAAKHLNAAISKGKPGPRRRGTVFPDRYHAEIITSPRQARHTLSYVLFNRPIPSGRSKIGRLAAKNWPVNNQITGQSHELSGHVAERRLAGYLGSNWRKHQEDRAAPMSTWTIDWFSSAAMFPGWAEYGEEAFLWRGPATYDPLVVYQPKTWLLREGWKKAGSISCHEVPSAKR
jgi:REP element-mobilizing transposase RayT